MSQWMTDVNDLLQTRLDADVLASDMPKEFEVNHSLVNLKRLEARIALNGIPMTDCDMGSHCIICYPTQAGWYSIYLSRRDGRLS